MDIQGLSTARGRIGDECMVEGMELKLSQHCQHVFIKVIKPKLRSETCLGSGVLWRLRGLHSVLRSRNFPGQAICGVRLFRFRGGWMTNPEIRLLCMAPGCCSEHRWYQT